MSDDERALDYDEYDDDSPYCQCDLEWTEEEEAANQCGCCGKLIS